MNLELLKKYKAKSDNTTIFQHNQDLQNIRKQIIDIYNIDEKTNVKLDKIINIHDIGKIVDDFQKNIESTHRKVRHEIISASVKNLENDERLAILTHHKQINDDKLLQNVTNNFYQGQLKEVSEKLDVKLEGIEDFITDIEFDDIKEVEDLNTILLKGYLQYCDHLASASVKTIEKGFNSLESFQFKNYNSIQRKVLKMNSEEDILIMAMTGLGKTATSLFWSNLVQNKEKSKRIYYILPFTASINSLYKDFNSRNTSVAMLHSKAEYFLDKLSEDEDIKELYQLYKKSVKQINICTIFQLVKSVFSCKRYEMLLAQMKNSIIIVDEIHCFATKELCYILEFLKFLKENLGVKICIMSASIPSCLQNLIQEKLGIQKVILADKNDLIIRHKINRIEKDIIEDLDKIREDLRNEKQVLVCVNSVKLAQELYQNLNNYLNEDEIGLIHGRFNTRDREKAEQDLKNKKLLIGTQSIEVSLDISYDVMYTEIAPFDALLQRFGRVNRKGKKGLSDIFIYNDTSNVYNRQTKNTEQDIILKTDRVLKEIVEIDDSMILEDKVQHYLDKVYLEIDKKEYIKHRQALKQIINNLRLGTYNKSVTDDMCSNDSMSVLPISLFTEYARYIDDKQYLEASSLTVNINSKRKLWDGEHFNYNEDYYVWIVDYKYNDKFGLLFENDTDDSFM